MGAPVYNEERHLREALDSLLGQSFRDFSLLILDNQSTDGTAAIAERYAASDPRVIVERGDHHVGMVDNFRRAFRRARALSPGAEYFAWVGGHDIWDPHWLEVLVGELDADPALVGAWPRRTFISEEGTPIIEEIGIGDRDTLGVTSPFDRLLRWLPGEAVYGLLRSEDLERTGLFRRVLKADKLLIAELSVFGQLKQIDQSLCRWRHTRLASDDEYHERELPRLFPEGVPLYARFPWRLQHGAAFAMDILIRSRHSGVSYADQASASMVVLAGRHRTKQLLRLRKRTQKTVKAVRRPFRRTIAHSAKRLRRGLRYAGALLRSAGD